MPELSGILNWLLKGWKDFYEGELKLRAPLCVQLGNEQYRKDSDITGRWIEACIEKAPDTERVVLKELQAAYVNWFQDEIGEKFNIQAQTLSAILKELKFPWVKGHGGLTFFTGIRLKNRNDELDAKLDVPLTQTGY
jgi:phage/plasmid-associated DNA primase